MPSGPPQRSSALTKQLADLQAQLTAGALRASAAQAKGAANAVEQLRVGLAEWNRFYDGYDPLYTWWMRMPYRKVDAALQAYVTHSARENCARKTRRRTCASLRCASSRRRRPNTAKCPTCRRSSRCRRMR